MNESGRAIRVTDCDRTSLRGVEIIYAGMGYSAEHTKGNRSAH